MPVFEYSTNGSTWISNLPQPAVIEGSAEDLDLDSYRSVVNGNIRRNILGYKWESISLSWNFIPEADAYTLINTFKQANNIYIRIKDATSSTFTKVLRGYVSKIQYKLVHAEQGYGYEVSFNFIEGKR